MTDAGRLVCCIWEVDGETIVRIFDSWEKGDRWREEIAKDHWGEVFCSEKDFDPRVFWENTTHGFTMETVEVE